MGQVLQYEGPYKGAMFPTIAPHQVLHYEDHCKGEMGSQGVQQPGNICKAVQQPGNVVNKNVSAPTEVEVNVKSVSVPTEVGSMSVPTEAENAPAPTEAELDVTMDPEVEKQMFSLAPSKNEGIIVNVAPTQFGDCNLASKNVSAPIKLQCGVNKKQMLSLAPPVRG